LAECLWRFGQWLAESKSLVILLKTCSYTKRISLIHSLNHNSHQNSSPSPVPPGKQPEHNRQAYTRGTPPRPALEAVRALAFRLASLTRHGRPRITKRVYDTPDCGTTCGHHGDDAPVRGKVLGAPHDADDYGDKAEGCAVTKTEEGGGGEEEGWVGGDERW
jgi:hypothetical protein